MTIQDWLNQTAKTLRDSYGLDESFSVAAARFIAYLMLYGLRPQITSGYRSPEYQEQLRRRYAAGDPSVIVPPAKDSKHSNTSWGNPASLAIDIKTSNPSLAAQIASACGIKSGLYFSTPDPVHFYI